MQPNIIFVLLDGARNDRLDSSKDFSALKKEGTLLDNVTTALPYTIGAINAIFSGLYGKDNGVDAYYKMFRLKDSVKILSEVFHENNYFTACDLLSNKILTKRGFDVHQFHDEYVDNLCVRHPDFIRKCIKESKGKPLFLFLYFSGIHTVTVSDVLKKYNWNDANFYEKKEKNLSKYDEVFNTAGIYAKIIKDTLNKIGISKKTILIFFSDHGTGVGERFGERNYGSFTYEETIRSFYLFIGNNITKNQHTSKLRESIDLFPTILDLAGIKNNYDGPGKTIAPYLLGKEKLKEKNYTFSETGALHGPYPSPKEPNVFCVKTPKYKLMYLKTPDKWMLYDLEADPNEINNLIDENIPIKQELKERLLKWIQR